MPKGKYLFDASKPNLEDFYEDMCSYLPKDVLQEFAATMATLHSIFELQALSEKHTEMGKVIKAYAMRPLIQKDFGERALTIYDNLIQQDEHKELSLLKFYQICKKLKDEVEQLREFINSKEMKFVTALADWPVQSAAELNDLNNFFDKTIKKHYQAIIAYLAKPGLQDSYGATPLICAAYKGHFATVKALLAQPGIDVNKANDAGNTPLHWAALRDYPEIVKALLAQPGIDVNKVDNAGNTPLHHAIYHGYLKTVRVLLAQPGIDVNKANEDGNTSLIWAVRHRDLDTIKMFLARTGIEVNKANDDDRTPLIIAAANGDFDIVEALLTMPGIDVNKADNGGKTPLYWAELRGHKITVSLIKNHIATKNNSATAVTATPGYAALRNQGAASNGAVSRSHQCNCCII